MTVVSESSLSEKISVTSVKKKFLRAMTYKSFCMILAEFLGTFLLVFFGCMGGVKIAFVPDALLMSLNFGFTVLMIIQIFGHISFALINPAVTVAAVISGILSIPMGIIYTIAQCMGACCGYGMLMALSPRHIFNTSSGNCLTLPHDTLSEAQALFVEFFLTFALVATVCGVWDPRNQKFQDSAGIRIGMTVATLCFAGGAYTGASLNPARSLAPALWNWNWRAHWLYWVGTMLGAVTAALLSRFVFQRNIKVQEQIDKLEEVGIDK